MQHWKEGKHRNFLSVNFHLHFFHGMTRVHDMWFQRIHSSASLEKFWVHLSWTPGHYSHTQYFRYNLQEKGHRTPNLVTLEPRQNTSLPIYLDMLEKFAVRVSKDKIKISSKEDCLITATCFVMQSMTDFLGNEW